MFEILLGFVILSIPVIIGVVLLCIFLKKIGNKSASQNGGYMPPTQSAPQRNICKTCGAEIIHGMKFCGNCGTAYAAAGAPEMRVVPAERQSAAHNVPPKHNRPLVKEPLFWIASSAGMLIFFGIIAALVYDSAHSVKYPDQTVYNPRSSSVSDISDKSDISFADNTSVTKTEDFSGTQDEYFELLAAAIESGDFSRVEQHPLYSQEDVDYVTSGSAKAYDSLDAEYQANDEPKASANNLLLVSFPPSDKTVCPRCEGTKKALCVQCNGSGKMTGEIHNTELYSGFGLGGLANTLNNMPCGICGGTGQMDCGFGYCDGTATNPEYRDYCLSLKDAADKSGMRIFQLESNQVSPYIALDFCTMCDGLGWLPELKVHETDVPLCSKCYSQGMKLSYIDSFTQEELTRSYDNYLAQHTIDGTEFEGQRFGQEMEARSREAERYRDDISRDKAARAGAPDFGAEDYIYCTYPEGCSNKVYNYSSGNTRCAYHR